MKKAQSTIEFTFAMVVILFLIYSMVQVFRWAGMDLANRRLMQDNQMTTPIIPHGTFHDPVGQLNGDTDNFLPIAAVYNGTVANGNASE